MDTLAQLMNLTMTEEYVPSEWRKSFVVPLYKSGNPEVAGSYRGIALGSCVAKVFTRVLTRRLGEYAEERILSTRWISSKEKLLRPNTDFEGVCELRRRKRRGTYLAFLDVNKAYDTVREDENVWCGGEVYQSLPVPVSRCGREQCTLWSAVKMV